MVYQFKQASYIKADPQIAGEQCERLEAEGRLTAKNLVDVNRPEDAPLHKAFEWNDSVAAEAYRESQARHILNCLIVVPEQSAPVRAYFNIERTEPTYKHIQTIMRSTDDKEQLLHTVRNELKAFRSKYAQLEELTEVFHAIDDYLNGE